MIVEAPPFARRLLIASIAAALSGCGFKPLYAPSTSEPAGPQGDLAAVQVALIPERSGQLLRQALQQRLDRGEALRKRYELAVRYSLQVDVVGFQFDASVTRERVSGTGAWTLKALDTGATVSTGVARSLDGLDILDQQYFSADVANETVQRRLAQNIASEITTQVAAFFRRRSQVG